MNIPDEGSKWEIPPKACPTCGVRGYMDRSELYFQNMTWKQIKAKLKRNDVLIIPVGSTEQHGAGAPPGEDTFLVTRMAEQVALRTGATVAQPIWYGSHPFHHIGMPGTIVIPEDVFTAQLRGVIAGFWNAGFRKQILLNGHGQEYVIPTAIHQFAKIYQVPAILVNVNWYHAIPDLVKDREHGGPFETPFIHADEAETSFSLALFPEMMEKSAFDDNEPRGYLPEGHVDKAGNVYQRPIKWYGQVGVGPVEVAAYPEGVVGKPSLAESEKAKPGLVGLLDYLEKLVNDILSRFPPGKLPPIEDLTQRPRAEVEAVLKGPLEKGGRHIYTLHYPP